MFANSFRKPTISLKLTNMRVFTDNDAWEMSSDADRLLSEASSYFQANWMGQEVDIMVLVTGQELDGGVVEVRMLQHSDQ